MQTNNTVLVGIKSLFASILWLFMTEIDKNELLFILLCGTNFCRHLFALYINLLFLAEQKKC